MSDTVQIFVALPNEAVDVWRPVQAKLLYMNVYRILDQSYDKSVESWQFEPGDEVICEMVESNAGRLLAAIRRNPPR